MPSRDPGEASPSSDDSLLPQPKTQLHTKRALPIRNFKLRIQPPTLRPTREGSSTDARAAAHVFFQLASDLLRTALADDGARANPAQEALRAPHRRSRSYLSSALAHEHHHG